jgi:hypothetical protein
MDRPGQRVDDVEIRCAHRLQRGVRTHLPVEGVARLEHDLVARLAANNRRDVRMPPVVARVRLLQQGLGSVDADLVNGHPDSLP